MATNYTRPLAEVYQLLEVTRQATGDHLSACIVGPTYDTYRYGIEDDVEGTQYSSSAQTINLTYAEPPLMECKVDDGSVKLYAEGLEAEVYAAATTWELAEDSTRVLKYQGTSFSDAIFKRQPYVGDVLRVQGDSSSDKAADWGSYEIIAVNVAEKTVTVDAPVTGVSSDGTKVVITDTVSGYIEATTSAGVTNWTYADGKITTKGALTITSQGTTMNLVDGVGTLYPEFRVLITPVDDEEDIFTITSVADIQNNFGTITVENTLAYACYCALKGSAGRTIYAIRTKGTSEDAFAAAMKKTEFDSSLYSFVPLTTDPDVADVVVKYNAEMSEPDVKMWRRTLIGTDSPGEYVLATTGNDAKPIIVTVTPTSTGAKTGTIKVDSTNINLKDVALESSYVSMLPGDKIKVGSNVYTIVGTVGKDSAEISHETAVVSVSTEEAELIKADTIKNTVQYLGAIADKYNTRRASVVFCDSGTIADDDRVITIPNMFLAAEIAGIASAVVPQQSITHTEVQTVTKASKMYTLYTNPQLDEIASKGVLIVTQDTKGTACYIRHQLTTEMDKGNLYYEESCTRNLDNISYRLADIVNKYIGKANVTTSALRAIKLDITAALTEFTQDSKDDMVGPSLVDWKNLQVYQDATFKDRVIITVDLYLPLPLNNIKLYAMAYVATVTI